MTREQQLSLTPRQIQTIFRDRNILIPGSGDTNTKYGRQALLKLGSLTARREIQGRTKFWLSSPGSTNLYD
jgi:hypothetical protein